MGTYGTMPNDSPDARLLLDVAPDQYVTERTRLLKEARASHDKESAKFYQSLKRPGVALWAVLAAGRDADDVHAVMASTTELGGVQAGGSNPASLSEATSRRRTVLEAFVGKAVKALAKWDAGAEKRRPEIRGLVDQLSRHPELATMWIDGTLRDLPDEQFGFGAFADVVVSAPAKPATSKKATPAPRDAAPKEPTRDLAAERRARAERAEQARQAKRDVAAAARDVDAAGRRADLARSAVRDAEKQLALAEREQAVATQRHERAVAHHESFH